MNGPDSLRKWVTIGRIDVSFELFSKNFAFVVSFGFFVELIAVRIYL